MESIFSQPVENLLNKLKTAQVRVAKELYKETDSFATQVLTQTLEELNEPQPIAFWLEIEQTELPDSTYLSEGQLILLTDRIEQTWRDYNFIPDYPVENMSALQRYNLLKSAWEEEVQHFTNDFELIDFCTAHPIACIKGKHCTCREAWNELSLKLEEPKPNRVAK